MLGLRSALPLFLSLSVAIFCPNFAWGEDQPTPAKTKAGEEASLSNQLKAAKDSVAPTYQLAYKFSPGEEFRTKVVHLTTVETTVKKVASTSKTRVISTRVWKIQNVDAKGNITFVNEVDEVDMWSSETGKGETKYNSTTDKDAPPGYEHMAKGIRTPLATITISPHGQILKRENAFKQSNPGIGDLTIPFPPQAIVVGQTWSIPGELTPKDEQGRVQVIKTRQLYKLESVENGVANISVEHQILTPVNDPKLHSQIVQRMQKGTIRFDLDAGRLLHKQMDLDESVIGFSGADSSMQYVARLTEEPVANSTAKKGSTSEKR